MEENEKRVYLDWAAAAPVHAKALDAFFAAHGSWGNPSSIHAEGQAAREQLNAARKEIAAQCATKASDLIFTSGATEANALAIEGRIAFHAQKGTTYDSMHALVLSTAHASTRAAFERIAELGVCVEELPLHGYALDESAAASRLRPETVLVSCDAADSETGVRFDTRSLARVVAGAPDAVLHVDASQLPLVESVERTRLGADLFVLDAQKIGGVRGIGALIGPGVSRIAALHGGGGQERGLRSGTEPVQLAVALAAALRAAATERHDFATRATVSRAELITHLSSVYPSIKVHTANAQLPHILSLSLPSVDTEYLAYLLNARGFAVATRSACDVGVDTISKSVFIFTGDSTLARSTLRISWGPSTPLSDIQNIVSVIAACLPLAPLATDPV